MAIHVLNACFSWIVPNSLQMEQLLEITISLHPFKTGWALGFQVQLVMKKLEIPFLIGYIGDYITQLYGDYNKPL